MKNKIKRTGFIIFCLIFISLVIYSITSVGAVSRKNHEYEKTLESFSKEPEIRADMLYFNRLDTRGQYVYDVLKKTISKGDKYTDLIPFVMTEEELFEVVRALTYDDPSVYHVCASKFDLQNHSYTETGKRSGTLVVLPSIVEGKYTRIWIPYTANDSDDSKFLEKAKARFTASLKKVDAITEDVHDPYLVCQLIHDYLCGVCKKVTSGGVYADTAYGALVEGEATSVGYAKAFKLLYARCSGNSYIVGNSNQYWNVALINDNYYNIDTYSDDLDGELNGAAVRGALSHLNLCRDDDSFYKNREKSIGAVPVCSDKTTYYSHNSLAPSTPSGVNVAVSRQIEIQRNAKNYYFEIYCELDNAVSLIRSAVSASLSENYPEYADGCEIYRLSEDVPAYLVKLTKEEG